MLEKIKQLMMGSFMGQCDVLSLNVLWKNTSEAHFFLCYLYHQQAIQRGFTLIKVKNWVDETSVDKIEVDETAVDETGVDEPGINQKMS